jgi:hypothetical protein
VPNDSNVSDVSGGKTHAWLLFDGLEYFTLKANEDAVNLKVG